MEKMETDFDTRTNLLGHISQERILRGFYKGNKGEKERHKKFISHLSHQMSFLVLNRF